MIVEIGPGSSIDGRRIVQLLAESVERLFLRVDLVGGGENVNFSEVVKVIVVPSSGPEIPSDVDVMGRNDVLYLVCRGSDVAVRGGSQRIIRGCV